MTAYHVIVEDGSRMIDTTYQEWTLELPTYTVLKPIFKNGREYQPGETIQLNPETAQGFIDLEELAPAEEPAP